MQRRAIEDKFIYEVRYGDIATIMTMLSSGDYQNTVESGGISALMVAAGNGNTEVVRLLIAAKALVNHQSSSKETALHYAVLSGHEDIIDILLAADANVNSQDNEKRTPLLLSTSCHNPNIGRRLIQKGADIELTAVNGRTPLISAADYGDAELTALLLGKGANVKARTRSGLNALMYAIRSSKLNPERMDAYMSIVNQLLAAHADKDAIDENGENVFMYTVDARCMQLINLFLQLGISLDHADKYGNTALMRAVQQHDDKGLAIVRLLIKAGANLDLKNKADECALSLTRQSDSPESQEMEQALIEAGADKSMLYRERGGKLLSLLAKNKTDDALVLLKSGVNVNVSGKDENTPLLHGIRLKRTDLVAAILDAGVDVDCVAQNNRTAIFEAVVYGEITVLKLLLARSAKHINLAVSEGRYKDITPLSYAVKQAVYYNMEKYLPIMLCLLEYGADLKASCEGKTCEQVARHHRVVAKALDQYLQPKVSAGSLFTPPKMSMDYSSEITTPTPGLP